MKPSLLLIEMSDAHSINASTAFLTPVEPTVEGGVLFESARRLLRRLDGHDRAYLRGRFPTARHVMVDDDDLADALGSVLENLDGFPDKKPYRDLGALEAWVKGTLLGLPVPSAEDRQAAAAGG